MDQASSLHVPLDLPSAGRSTGSLARPARLCFLQLLKALCSTSRAMFQAMFGVRVGSSVGRGAGLASRAAVLASLLETDGSKPAIPIVLLLSGTSILTLGPVYEALTLLEASFSILFFNIP